MAGVTWVFMETNRCIKPFRTSKYIRHGYFSKPTNSIGIPHIAELVELALELAELVGRIQTDRQVGQTA